MEFCNITPEFSKYLNSNILRMVNDWDKVHRVKSFQMRSYFSSLLPRTHIQSECRKIRTRNNSVFWHFSRSGSFMKNDHLWIYYQLILWNLKIVEVQLLVTVENEVNCHVTLGDFQRWPQREKCSLTYECSISSEKTKMIIIFWDFFMVE